MSIVLVSSNFSENNAVILSFEHFFFYREKKSNSKDYIYFSQWEEEKKVALKLEPDVHTNTPMFYYAKVFLTSNMIEKN